MCVLIKFVVLLSQSLDNWTLSLNALLPEAPLHRPGAGARAGLAGGAAADSVLDETESVFTAPTAGLERGPFTAHPRSVHGNSSTIGPPGFHDRRKAIQPDPASLSGGTDTPEEGGLSFINRCRDGQPAS